MAVAVLASAAPTIVQINLCGCGISCSMLDMNRSINSRIAITVGHYIAGGITTKRYQKCTRRGRIELYSTMTWAWQDFRAGARSLSRLLPFTSHQRLGGPFVVCEIAGQYEDTFDDVDEHLLDYFTYKAVKTILAQLHEMNPDQHTWFHDFVVKNKPQDGKLFLRALVKERRELGERVMVTRLHLFNKWVKRYKHDNVEKAISDQNLDLLRERLIQTVRMPSDGEDFESPLSST
ncbi:hypothetical protein O6H91_01G129600 [Diphasiastrum complanatum]|uniref:Uncharacterized protein n=3 Tax=Diphasiastrum complanatum TaxID=34168 RepID=A0ACC2EWC7_DIPCM|nr:hypothetical protein O6H91_01G129600 [Diphasiastrum complanatum]KAJ7570636.1 hypothetical protein O6H91_01G129600 [Diphasiastrum complanatum]KAJ7570637.1 hypothetical protein O6H91_01G129600 [Diphasiastrum complanatum]